MQSHPPIHPDRQGFTLIELLTVMAIIAVLVGLLFPVASAVSNNAKKTQAAADLRTITTSCSSYQADYGRLPLTSGQLTSAAADGKDVSYGSPSADANSQGYQLYDILRARADAANSFNLTNEYNPKKVVYFEANNVKNKALPTAGMLTDDFPNGKYTIKSGAFVDPWGSEYVVWLDANGDGDLHDAVKVFYTNLAGAYGPRGSVCTASMGSDKAWGSNNSGVPEKSDDIVSWK